MFCLFVQWDPMITTLPGLYLVSVGVIKPLAWLAGWTGKVVCSIGMLRFVNLLFNGGNLYLLYLIISKLHLKDKVSYNPLWITAYLVERCDYMHITLLSK